MGLTNFTDFSIPTRHIRGKMPAIEFQHPDCIMLVFPSGRGEFEVDYDFMRSALSRFMNLEWKGKPNALSKEHLYWDIIYITANATEKALITCEGQVSEPFRSSRTISENSYEGFSLSEAVRKWRSTVDMDGVTSMARETFYQSLLLCMPSGLGESGLKQIKQLALPFRVLPWDSKVRAVLFVHMDVGLPDGLYVLVRNEDHLDELRTVTRSEFLWVKPDGCPNDLPLYELVQGDCRELSRRLSCHQDIANDGCFSLGMVARLEPNLHDNGLGCIHGFSGKLECLVKFCISKHMQWAFLLLV